MNQKYVTSLELSKQLKEAGIPQESEWYWVYTMKEWTLQNLTLGKSWSQDHWEKVVSAFHVGELGEMLPKLFSTWKTLNGKGDETYCCFSESRGLYEHSLSEAEARGKMLLYLKKEGLI